MYMPTKNYLRKKAIKLCIRGQIVIESHSFLKYWQNCELHVPGQQVVPVAEFKEFERWFKFKPRFKYGWFYLKLYQMFQDLSRR